MLKVGLPKGRLLQRSHDAVAALRGVEPDLSVGAWFLRMPDIPDLVAEGLLDVGIVGDEWLVETAADVLKVAPLCWYHVRVCALHHPGATPSAGPVRFVSEYRAITHEFATERCGENFIQRTVRGSVEHYLPDLADIAVECVETGESMRRRGLAELTTLFGADVWLICSSSTGSDSEIVATLRRWADVAASPDRSGCTETANLWQRSSGSGLVRSGS